LKTILIHKQYRDIYKEYSADIFRYAFSLLKNREDAEDVMHEVFLKYMDNNQSYKQECSIKTWLLILTRNKCYNLLSQRKIRQSVDADDMEVAYRSDFDDKISLNEALLTLSPEENELLYLKEYGGFSYVEIGEITGLSLSNVKIKLFRTRNLLKKLLLEE